MKRAVRMPFGAEVRDGGVRFRLWAPALRAPRLLLEPRPGASGGEGGRELALRAEGGGWFEAEVAEARAGSRYRFALDDGSRVPDPASRFQPDGVHEASEVVDPAAYAWREAGWRGRPWKEAVLYELHVGAFTPEGTYAAAAERLDHLAALGVTAVELMPLAACPGARNWGYDGVLPYAPDARYGRPEALKAFVDAAHARGLMVFLDVVYNHFGPEGNYLEKTAPAFFTRRHHTPWGAAIDFDGGSSAPVREFFVRNALYWIEEYFLDGLRLDAVHAIRDDSSEHVLAELARRVREAVGPDRHVHLVLENDANEAHWLERGEKGRVPLYTAQWNDDLHHALHVSLTGEDRGYYVDYADDPAAHLGRALAEGFAWQGEPSAHRDGARRGEPSAALPPTAFVGFLQNHDQVGNRAFGERIVSLAPAEAVRAALAVLLLAPQPPLLFMGEEWGSERPFPFFCDFGPDLAPKVREGRRREFARFPEFRDPKSRARIPDPCAEETFRSAVLDWSEPGREPHAGHLEHVRALLVLRQREIAPRLAGARGHAGAWKRLGGPASRALRVRWELGDGSALVLRANLAPEAAALRAPGEAGRLLYATPREADAGDALPAWSAAWFLEAPT